MTASAKRRPYDAVAIQVDPAWVVAPLIRVHGRGLERGLVDLGDAGLGGIFACFEAVDSPRRTPPGEPDRPVGRIVVDTVRESPGPQVPRRIKLLAPFIPWPRNPPVSVGVDHRGTPTLRDFLVSGLIPEPRVQPADHLGITAEPKGVILVLAELQMVSREATVDQAERLGVDIVHRDLTAARVHREVTSRGMIGAISAPFRLIPRRADG